MVLHLEALQVATLDMLLLAMPGRVRASNAISLDTGVRSVLGCNKAFGFCQSSSSILIMFSCRD